MGLAEDLLAPLLDKRRTTYRISSVGGVLWVRTGAGLASMRATKWACKNREAYNAFRCGVGSDPAVIGSTGTF